ncbi:MAG: hypothetical protein A2Y78_00840 [Acidobacteria bacterium RBG_13_68_16]|nr:MAG: hypothetical protein A2Y78_00840 [Acidobacteria bacterium RBG_13_68_16]
MRTRALTVLLVVVALASAVPAAAHHGTHGHARVHWGVGMNWGWGWGAWGWGPWWWGAPVGYQQVPGTVAAPDLAAVDTDVDPEHARVLLDGEVIGSADDFDGYPDYLYLKPGHYTVEFTLQGYRSEKVEIDAQSGRYFPIKLELERIPGEKTIPWYDRPQGMPVGRVFGPKTVTPGGVPKAGPDPALRPELREPGRASARGVRATFGSALDLRITPSNAAVYIDGVLVGTGEELERLERGLAVAPGKHRIEVLAPGHASKTVDVEAKEGERQQIVVELDGGGGET